MIYRFFIGLFTICLGLIGLAIYTGSTQSNFLIAYTETNAQQNSRVVLMDINTGVHIDISTNIRHGSIAASVPRWSLEGESVAFWSYRNRREAFVYEINLPDYQEINLTEQWGYLSLPIFSPSGILGFSDSPRYELAPFYMTNDENNTSERFIENLVGEPQWSPDGRYFAYLSQTDLSLGGLVSAGEGLESSEIDLYVLDTESGDIMNLTSDSVAAGAPSWSPDGTQIAFIPISIPAGVLHVVDIATGEISQPTQTRLRSQPKWSPDGQYMTFVYATNSNFEIGLLDLNTNQVRNISNSPSYDLQPDWSSDSKQIVFVSGRGEQDDLYVYHLEQDELEQVTFTAENESDPAWRP